MFRPAVLFILVVALVGCTADDPPTTTPLPEGVTPEPTAEPAIDKMQLAALQLPLSGEFVSQGAETLGSVSLEAISDDEFSIALSGFSTEPADDIRIRLSPSEPLQDSEGHYYVDFLGVEVDAKVDGNLPDQTFIQSMVVLTFGQMQSLTIYDYGNRVALGVAKLD